MQHISVWWNALNNRKVVSHYEIVFAIAWLCFAEHGLLLKSNEIGIIKDVVDNKFVQILQTMMLECKQIMWRVFISIQTNNKMYKPFSFGSVVGIRQFDGTV